MHSTAPWVGSLHIYLKGTLVTKMRTEWMNESERWQKGKRGKTKATKSTTVTGGTDGVKRDSNSHRARALPNIYGLPSHTHTHTHTHRQLNAPVFVIVVRCVHQLSCPDCSVETNSLCLPSCTGREGHSHLSVLNHPHGRTIANCVNSTRERDRDMIWYEQNRYECV